LIYQFEVSENCPTITWQEPDFLNVLGVCKDDASFAKGTADKLEEQLRGFFRLFGNELFNREVLYYRHLLKNEASEADFDRAIQTMTNFEEEYCANEKVGRSNKSNPKEGYAVLDSRTERFLITKPWTVIGREPSRVRTEVTWEVDVPVRNNRRVSKQQALILYNFQTKKFELKNISAKFPVEVDGKRVTYGDEPQPIDNGSVIEVSGETFHFYLAKAASNR
jgi:hypothetical protein